MIFIYDGSGQLVAEYSTELSETPQVSYLTSDHLGSPRVITNELGAVTNRKDYMAFGEETLTAQRTTQLKYENQTETRKGYTGYEKDEESGLDFAQARYYNSSHGRYTSVDPLTASANVKNPQTFNRYSYVLNSPYKYVDPLGLISVTTGACGNLCPGTNGGAMYSPKEREEEESPTQQHEATHGQPPPPRAEQNAEPPPAPAQISAATQTATATVESQPSDCNGICAGTISEIKVTVKEVAKADSVQKYQLPGETTESLRIGSDLVFNFQLNGKSIVGTAQESVENLEGDKVYQEKEKLPLRDGNMGDIVATPSQPIPNSNGQAAEVVRNFNKDFITKQRITITVTANNGLVFQVIQERTLTNRGNAPRIAGGVIKGYTFTMDKPTIKIINPPRF